MCSFLEWLYPDYGYALLEQGSRRFPVVVFPAPTEQQCDVDSVLGNLVLSVKEQEELVVDDSRYLRLTRAFDRKLWDGQTYVMERLTLEPRLQLECRLGRYFDTLRSCDVLEWELLAELGKRRWHRQNFERLANRLPLRHRLHNVVPDPIVSGHGRSAALAGSTLVVFNDGTGLRVFLRQRSSRVAVHAQLYHVVPSFMIQPFTPSVEKEYSVIHNVLREFGEELFDIKELEQDRGYGGYVAFDWFYEAPPVKELRVLLATGEAQLLLTGVAVNLLNLRPEVCTLLLILTPDWYRVHSKDIESRGLLHYNWEFADAAEIARTRQVGLAPRSVVGPYGSLLSYGNVAPPGAAAYYLGLGVAADVLAAKGLL